MGTPLNIARLSSEARSTRGRCKPALGSYFCHLTAMDGGNAGNVWNHFPALAKDSRFYHPPTRYRIFVKVVTNCTRSGKNAEALDLFAMFF